MTLSRQDVRERARSILRDMGYGSLAKVAEEAMKQVDWDSAAEEVTQYRRATVCESEWQPIVRRIRQKIYETGAAQAAGLEPPLKAPP
jgi:hypothetical protein